MDNPRVLVESTCCRGCEETHKRRTGRGLCSWPCGETVRNRSNIVVEDRTTRVALDRQDLSGTMERTMGHLFERRPELFARTRRRSRSIERQVNGTDVAKIGRCERVGDREEPAARDQEKSVSRTCLHCHHLASGTL